MYAENMDWLHLGKDLPMTEIELVAQVQDDTTDDGTLSQATEGTRKQEKCST